MASHDAEASVAAHFARQYGVITVHQAHASGLTDRMIEYRVRSGRWIRLASGIYVVASAAADWQRDLAAALLWHPRAVGAGRSAAALHGFPGMRHRRPEVLVPRNSNARSPFARVYRSAFFDEIRTVRVAGFEVTSPAETVLTLAATLPAHRIEVFVDETLLRRTAGIAEYSKILDRLEGGRVRGAAVLRRIVAERRTNGYQPPASELERLSRRLTDRPEVPPVSHQHPVLGSAGPTVVDTFIDDWLIVLEVDGRNYHTRKADFERDRRRDNAAAALGYVTLRFTWQMLTTDFDDCVKTLLEVGRKRQNLLRRPMRVQ